MDIQLKNYETDLDSSISLRFATWDDLAAVTQLVYDVCEADGDTAVAVTEEEMASEWRSPGFNIETDGIVAITKDGRIVGYEEFFNEHGHSKLRTDGYVHPEFKGLGIGTALMRAVGERAQKEIPLAESDVRVHIYSILDSKDADGRNIHESEGYQEIRYHWRMGIELDGPPDVPALPEGIELRPFDMAHDRALHEAHEEAFSDLWRRVPRSYEEWTRHNEGRDRSLWLVAWDGDQIAGYTLIRERMGIGYVSSLGVRRPWRKRGLGEALLLHSFRSLFEHGHKTIGLGVDAQNPSGATRLYQKVGMKIVAEYVSYEKELRPGRDLEEQDE